MKNPMYVDFAIYPYCNLRCSFCYAEAEGESIVSDRLLRLSDFERIFQQFDEVGVLRVGFEGGEPFLRKEWYDIFKLADQNFFNYFVNTNATMIDDFVADKLADTDIDKVCVSLDGPNASIHDLSRGKAGTFELTVRGIKNLVSRGINVNGIITLTKYNMDSVVETLQLMKDLGIQYAAIMLLATVGKAEKNISDCYMTYDELKKTILHLTDLKKQNRLPVSLSIVPVGEGQLPWELYLPLKEAGREDDLKYWVAEDLYYSLSKDSFGCTAGKDNFFVNAFGDVYGCSMMSSISNLKAGNLKENSLLDIWNNSAVFKMLRTASLADVEGACKNCEVLHLCKGGCRACAYAATGKITGSDERCPYTKQSVMD